MALEDIQRDNSVLILSPTFGEKEPAICSTLLDRGNSPDTAALFVSFTDTPTELIEFWEANVGKVPGLIEFVLTGKVNVSSAQEESTRIRIVRNPSNLTQVGVEITNALSDIRVEAENIVICFRSLSALLQYASPNQAFQFMTVLLNRFKEAGAAHHVHLNSAAHDQQTIVAFTQVFDVVIEIEEDGSHTIMK